MDAAGYSITNGKLMSGAAEAKLTSQQLRGLVYRVNGYGLKDVEPLLAGKNEAREVFLLCRNVYIVRTTLVIRDGFDSSAAS